MGYLLKWEEGGAKITFETDTISCSHCQKVMELKRWREEAPWCYCCGHAICLPCLQINRATGCVPFMKMVEQELQRQRLFREV